MFSLCEMCERKNVLVKTKCSTQDSTIISLEFISVVHTAVSIIRLSWLTSAKMYLAGLTTHKYNAITLYLIIGVSVA